MNCARFLPLCSTQTHKPPACSPHSLLYVAFNICLLSTPNLLQLGTMSHCLEAGGEGTALTSLQSPTCPISPSLVKHLLKPKKNLSWSYQSTSQAFLEMENLFNLMACSEQVRKQLPDSLKARILFPSHFLICLLN